jgi:hypothetical protein
MMMNMEQSVEWEFAGEIEVLEENLHQYQFVTHKSHMTWPGLETDHRYGKPAANRLSYGTALSQVTHIHNLQAVYYITYIQDKI